MSDYDHIRTRRCLWIPIDDLDADQQDEVEKRCLKIVDSVRSKGSPVLGWTIRDGVIYIRSLPSNQRKVLKRAIENGGSIDRDEVYSLLGFPSTRALTGFTKPYGRVMRDKAVMTRDGFAATAKTPIFAMYDPDPKRAYLKAIGFKMPDALVPVFQKAVEYS